LSFERPVYSFYCHYYSWRPLPMHNIPYPRMAVLNYLRSMRLKATKCQ